MINGMPVLRLEIDRLKERITHALVMREDELSDAVSAGQHSLRRFRNNLTPKQRHGRRTTREIQA